MYLYYQGRKSIGAYNARLFSFLPSFFISSLKNRFSSETQRAQISFLQFLRFFQRPKESRIRSQTILRLPTTIVSSSCFNKTRQRITTGYRERKTINLKCIGLIEKRFVRASDRLSVSMSDNVEHSRLNGLGMRRCSPFPSLSGSPSS